MLCLRLFGKICIYSMLKKMAVNSNTWSDLFTKKFSDYSGYVSSLDDAMRVLKAYEVATTSTFTVIKQTKGFGSTSNTRNLKGISVIYL